MSNQRTHRVAVIPGDGIGPEVTSAALNVVAATGVTFETKSFDLGAARYLRDGFVLDDDTLEELRAFGSEFGEDFFAAITLAATLDCHDVTGGTARGRVRTALHIASERIAQLTAHAKVKTAEAAHVGA